MKCFTHRKQPTCPSTEEWTKKMWYIYAMEYYYSAIKWNEIGSFAEMWMDLETVLQSEVSQKEKNKYRTLTHIYGIQKSGIDVLICKAEIDTDVENKCTDTKGEGGCWDELGDWD